MIDLLRRLRSALVVAGALTLGSCLLVPSAHASSIPDPIVSGLDAATYSGSIPTTTGDLMAFRTLDTRVSLAGAASGFRILYSTTNARNQKAVSTGAVFLPPGTPPPGGWPVVAWAHGTVGTGDDCAPSVQPRDPGEAAYLNHWLGRGFAIVATDYVGMGTPGLLNYLDGVSAAHSVVDSVIAARALPVALSRTWLTIGHSEGAGAALNTARYADEFSRGSDLDFRGVVATGAPANLETIIQYGGPTFPPVVLPRSLNGYTLYILAGLRDARPDLNIDAVLTDEGRRLADIAESVCGTDIRPYAQDLDLRTLFRAPLSTIPGIYDVLRSYLGTPDSGYAEPVFLGQGLLDVTVPAPSALSLAAQMTANRVPLELRVYPSADHAGVLVQALPDADAFVSRVMGR